jgi:hypothetical protein
MVQPVSAIMARKVSIGGRLAEAMVGDHDATTVRATVNAVTSANPLKCEPVLR